jgi:hypothetical protein
MEGVKKIRSEIFTYPCDHMRYRRTMCIQRLRCIVCECVVGCRLRDAIHSIADMECMYIRKKKKRWSACVRPFCALIYAEAVCIW